MMDDEKSMIEYPWVSIKIVEFQEEGKILCSIDNSPCGKVVYYVEGSYCVASLSCFRKHLLH